MKQDKYMGLDVHQAMTVVVVLDAEGKVILETMVSTEAAAILRLVKSLSGPLRVTFEETTQAEWLHEVLRSHVTEVVVCDPRRNKLLNEGSKADKGRCAETGGSAANRNVTFGLSRARGHAEIEGIGPGLRNVLDRHATDDGAYQGDLPRTGHPDSRPWSLPSQTAGAVAGEVKRAGTTAARGMAV